MFRTDKVILALAITGFVAALPADQAAARASGLYSFEQYFPQAAGYPPAPAPSVSPAAPTAPTGIQFPARAPSAQAPTPQPSAASPIPPRGSQVAASSATRKADVSDDDDDSFLSGNGLAGGWYIGLSGGLASVWDKTDNTPRANFLTTYSSGMYGSLSAGYSFGRSSEWWRGFRPEFELSYLKSDYDKITYRTGTSSPSGDLSAFTALLNGFYDFDFGDFQPFLGAGFGVSQNKKKASTATIGGVPVGEPERSKTDFAAMAEVGLNYRVTQNFLLGPSYRVMLINNGDATAFPNYRYDDNHVNIFKLNARWHFNP